MADLFWGLRVELCEYDKYSYPNINGSAYCIGEEQHRYEGQERGFGGRLHYITFDDGNVVKTTNLYLNGDIPEDYINNMPNNAHWSTKDEVERGPIYIMTDKGLKEVKDGKAE